MLGWLPRFNMNLINWLLTVYYLTEFGKFGIHERGQYWQGDLPSMKTWNMVEIQMHDYMRVVIHFGLKF